MVADGQGGQEAKHHAAILPSHSGRAKMFGLS
jgi:hypothetical protein